MNKIRFFTLIEIVVAAALLVLMIGIAASSYSFVRNRALETRSRAMLENLHQAIEDIRDQLGFLPETDGFETITVTQVNGIPVRFEFGTSGSPGSVLTPAEPGVPPTAANRAYELLIKELELPTLLSRLNSFGKLTDNWGTPVYYSGPGKINTAAFDLVSAGGDLLFGKDKTALPPETEDDYRKDGKMICDDLVFF